MAYRFTTILIISFAMLSGCSNLYKTPPELKIQRQEALARWDSCLHRVSQKASEEPVKVTSDLITNICDGHRRDVLLSFPASMERQLDAELMERGLRASTVPMLR